MNLDDYARDPALHGFAGQEANGWRILARQGYGDWAAAWAAGGLEAVRRVGGGRADHPVAKLPDGGEAVVRQYRRGGMMRHLNRDRYLIGHRAFEEARVTMAAAAAGVRVPEVIAAGERRSGLTYRAWLATRWIVDATGLEQWLARRSPAEVSAALSATGDQIGRMHDSGITHPDLNLRNVLVVAGSSEAPDVYLIDFDKAVLLRSRVHARQRARELRRLARSARKLGVPLDASAWVALREGYGSAWPPLLLPSP